MSSNRERFGQSGQKPRPATGFRPNPSAQPDFDEDAIQRRRQERLKRKQEDRRDEDGDTFEDPDPDTVLEDQKRGKRRKQKKRRPELWSDESVVDGHEDDYSEWLQRKNRGRDTDQDEVWDE
jgi:hypothetical protein